MIPDRITELSLGAHNVSDGEYCLMEAVSVAAGEPFGDHPNCIPESLGELGRKVNDMLPYDKRQRLLPLVLPLANSSLSEEDVDAARYAWGREVWLPAWLKLAGITWQPRESLHELQVRIGPRLATRKMLASSNLRVNMSGWQLTPATDGADLCRAASAAALHGTVEEMDAVVSALHDSAIHLLFDLAGLEERP